MVDPKMMEYIPAYVDNVDDEGLNVRSGPGTSNKILSVIPYGTSVLQIGYNVEQTWTKVYVGMENSYWVSSKYLNETPRQNIFKVVGADSEGLNVRNSKSTSGKILNTIKNGTHVGVFNLNKDGTMPTWAKVSPNTERYCYGKYLKKTDYEDFDPEPGRPVN